jgi:hypothetical protein
MSRLGVASANDSASGNSPAPLRPKRRRRRGAVLVEVALIGPLALMLVFGLIIGGIAVFRLHQVTTHGPVNPKRHAENEAMLSECPAERVYITAFLDKADFFRGGLRGLILNLPRLLNLQPARLRRPIDQCHSRPSGDGQQRFWPLAGPTPETPLGRRK